MQGNQLLVSLIIFIILSDFEMSAWKQDVKGRILGVKAQMCTYNMLFGLKLCEKILLTTDNLSMTLQKELISASSGDY